MNTPEKPKQKIERDFNVIKITGEAFSFTIVINEENYEDFVSVIKHHGNLDLQDFYEVIDITQYPGDSFTHYSIETWTQ